MKRLIFRVTALMMMVILLAGISTGALANSWTCRVCGRIASGSYCSCGAFVNYEMIGSGTVHGLTGRNTLNLRERPGTDARILAELRNGDAVSVFSVNGGWIEIDYHGVHGYASARYISVDYDLSQDDFGYSDAYTPGEAYYIANQRLSTRTGPGTDYDGKGKTVEYPDYANRSVKVISAAWDSRNSIWWLQVEVEKGGNLRRVYTGLKRFNGVDVNCLRRESVVYSSSHVNTSVYPHHGPGTRYQQMGTRINAGTWGRVISIENGYCQFEYESNGYKHRCWIPQSCIDIW